MRYLDGEEKAIADAIYAQAVIEGGKATCAKSKRGVIFARGTAILGRGSNGPPQGYACVPEFCRKECAAYAIHAEARALLSLLKAGHSLSGVRGYHVKVVDGKALPSGTPSCLACSKQMIDAGVEEFVLQDEQGFALYTIEEFHDETLKNCFGEEFEQAVKKT